MSKVSKCRGKSGGFFSGKEYEKESCTKRQLSRKKEIFWVNRNIVDLSQESFFESCFSDWKSTFLWVSLKTSSVFKVSPTYFQHFIKKIVALNYSGILCKVEWARTEGPREESGNFWQFFFKDFLRFLKIIWVWKDTKNHCHFCWEKVILHSNVKNNDFKGNFWRKNSNIWLLTLVQTSQF